MPAGRWSAPRLVAIWVGWPILLAALVLLVIFVFQTGIAIDLIHLREAPLAVLALMLLLVGPPALAAWVG
jgi:hypothetical protein